MKYIIKNVKFIIFILLFIIVIFAGSTVLSSSETNYIKEKTEFILNDDINKIIDFNSKTAFNRKINFNSNKLDVLLKYYNNKKIEKTENISDSRSLENFKDKKLLAITFDDGPSKYTNKLLDNLDKYNARVTFFVVGSRVNNYKDILYRAYEMGNQIGNHTFNHKKLTKLNNDDIMYEIESTNDSIEKIIGIKPSLLRPPYGSVDDNVNSLTDMSIILWDVDTEDWKYRDKNRVSQEIIRCAHDGAIILLHDLYETSVDGALIAMEQLSQEGYAFVTIDEMSKLKNIELNNYTKYRNIK